MHWLPVVVDIRTQLWTTLHKWCRLTFWLLNPYDIRCRMWLRIVRPTRPGRKPLWTGIIQIGDMAGWLNFENHYPQNCASHSVILGCCFFGTLGTVPPRTDYGKVWLSQLLKLLVHYYCKAQSPLLGGYPASCWNCGRGGIVLSQIELSGCLLGDWVQDNGF